MFNDTMGWLFRILFPQQRALLMQAAKVAAEADIGRKYRKMLYSMERSPLDESKLSVYNLERRVRGLEK